MHKLFVEITLHYTTLTIDMRKSGQNESYKKALCKKRNLNDDHF